MDAFPFPAFHAGLNLAAASLLLLGYGSIRRQRVRVHRSAMLGAFSLSVLFLASYVIYHWKAGSSSYTGQGWLRGIYLVILISHSILAGALPFLAVITLGRALRGRYEQHRRIARWTLPLWLYVNFTGVLIYWILYRV